MLKQGTVMTRKPFPLEPGYYELTTGRAIFAVAQVITSSKKTTRICYKTCGRGRAMRNVVEEVPTPAILQARRLHRGTK